MKLLRLYTLKLFGNYNLKLFIPNRLGVIHFASLLFLGLFILIGQSSAKAGADINRFHAPMTMDGLVGEDSSQGLYPYQPYVGGYLTYARRPLVWRYAPDGAYEEIIARQLILDIVATIGAMRPIDVSLALPIFLMQRGPNQAALGDDSLAGAGIGDLRVIPRVTIFRERSWGFGLAFIPELVIPTGFEKQLMGDPSVTFRPRATASLPLYKLFPARLLAGLGYNWRRNAIIGDTMLLGDEAVLGDEWLFHLGSEIDFDKLGIPVTGLVDLSGASAATRPLSGDGLTSLEILVGARTKAISDFVVMLGVGGGITRGIGTPTYRFILGFGWAPLPPDRDGDGIPDITDLCPEIPEDYDQFEDEDGCPEPDNDQDGLADAVDKCPNEPEDINGVEDGDGCPDTGIRDQDRDGIPDDDDMCPVEPEDRDQFEDKDGCPDPDHDHDGITDDRDNCPTEKETINGINDEDGCPDEGQGATTYHEKVKIDISETILFESGKDTIMEQSKKILNQVALQILAHPEIRRIRIEGHTDSVGPEQGNLILSQDRANAVRRYLISRNVRPETLQAEGFGESKPIDSNSTPRGRSNNRRVEFVIVDSR